MHFDLRCSRIGTESLPKAVRSLRGWRRLALGTWALGHDGLVDCPARSAAHVSLEEPKQAQRDAQRETKGLALADYGSVWFWSVLLFPSESLRLSKTGLSDISLLIDFQDGPILVDVQTICACRRGVVKIFRDCLKDLQVQHKLVP